MYERVEDFPQRTTRKNSDSVDRTWCVHYIFMREIPPGENSWIRVPLKSRTRRYRSRTTREIRSSQVRRGPRPGIRVSGVRICVGDHHVCNESAEHVARSSFQWGNSKYGSVAVLNIRTRSICFHCFVLIDLPTLDYFPFDFFFFFLISRWSHVFQNL